MTPRLTSVETPVQEKHSDKINDWLVINYITEKNGEHKDYFFENISKQNTYHYAAAAKSLQSCPTLCDPIDGSPPGSTVPGILQARTLECVAISFSNAGNWKVKVKSLSRVRPSATPWTAAHQAPPSMRFSRREYQSGVPLGKPKSHKRASGKLKPSPLERDIIFHFSIDYKKIFREGGKGKFFIFTSLDYL